MGERVHSEGGKFAVGVAREFRAFIGDSRYPCLGARAALNSDSCRIRCYGTLGRKSFSLARDLAGFVHSALRRENKFATFVAVFRSPLELDEAQFERRLWMTLQQLHSFDAEHRIAWDETVANDPSRADFAFSFGGVALYVVGLHANSSRHARRFRFPTLVFNPHEQFRRLRADGKWERMRGSIRQREIALQGSVNPMLDDFGQRSEARQYSGRSVPDDWAPPFRPNGCPFAR